MIRKTSFLSKIIVYVFFGLCFSYMHGQMVKASSFEGLNDTETLYAAIHSKYDTIVLDNKPETWCITPMRFKNVTNKVILMEKGVEVWAKRGAFLKSNDALWTFLDCNKISIIGNKSHLFMNKDEYNTGEWRHGISLRGSKDIVIMDITIANTGGDGIYIAGTKKNKYSQNILIERVKSINNRRQGLTIISAKNVRIANSIFAETKGTLPGAGLDIEPNSAEDLIQDIEITDCIFENNYGAGIIVGLRKLESTSEEISVHFENCVLRGNHSVKNKKVAAEIIIGANSINPVKGNLVFNKLYVENSNWGLLYTRKLSEAFYVKFKDCTLKNISKKGIYSILYFEVPDYYKPLGALGGMSFENIYIDNAIEADLLVVRGSKLGTLTGFENVSGTFNYKGQSLSDKPLRYINYSHKKNKNVNFDYSKIE